MRNILFLRGLMGVGKSTVLKELGLDPWVISSDKIRLLFNAPVYNEQGKLDIIQDKNKQVFQFIRNLVEDRMSNREFIVIDATHINLDQLQPYKKLCDTYRYQAWILDLTDIDLDIALERNKGRLFEVPEYVIYKAYETIKNTTSIPSWLKIVKPNDLNDTLNYQPNDFSHWKKINHIGDIHGCYTVLNEYLQGRLKEDELYIFCGDYIDRGIENFEVLNMLITISNKPNVILLEGNHEKWLWKFANNEDHIPNSFLEYTKPQIERIDKKKIKNFYRKLRTFVYYKYYDKTVLVSHGGLTFTPDRLFTLNEDLFIKGIGDYETNVDELFSQNAPDNFYQIHGHRNIGKDIFASKKSFNLEGKVEFGGNLRIVSLDKEGFKERYIKNNVFFKSEVSKIMDIELSNQEFLESLRHNDYIKEKKLSNNVSSFNFTREAFCNSIWDLQSIKARGLFINTDTSEIVARSYDKFFNLNEIEEVKEENLNNNLKYPIKFYIKENGYLGITGYNNQFDKPFIASKSTSEGDFSNWFEILLKNSLKDNFDTFFNELKEKNLSAVFEVIDVKNDPHIINYKKSKIVLLDLIYREQKFRKCSDEERIAFSKKYSLETKKLYRVFESEVFSSISQLKSFELKIEGFVVEDNNGYMFKIKLDYYKFWKKIRGLKESLRKGAINYQNLNIEEKKIIDFLKKNPQLLDKDVITIRKEYTKSLIIH